MGDVGNVYIRLIANLKGRYILGTLLRLYRKK
jgi:hypothetical protein